MSPEIVEATRRQLAHWRAGLDSGAHRIGWKIGFNVPEMQRRLGLERSLIGHLTSATLVGAAGAHSLAGAANPLLEPEIAIEVGPGHTIGGLAPALEVVDMPKPPSGPEEIPAAIEHNIFHRAVAIGSSSGLDSAAGVQAQLTVDGELHAGADASSVDLPATIELVAETLEAAGERLEAGDRIIAGTLTPPAQVSPGANAALDLGRIGRLEITFTH